MEAGTARTEEAARKRAAVEMIASHGSALKATARRFSIDAEDADDAYQRALEIVLTKAPTTSPRDLIRWTQTVVKHEALAVRQGRERLHGYRRDHEDRDLDPVANLVAPGGTPDERVERGEEIARAREALHALKPAELQALSLLAEGYSYAEIGDLTGFSRTKVNRLLAEGRDRFRKFLANSEDGSRCRELRPLLSAFCDGETRPRDAALVREHLRACGRCRATMRAYRAAPRIAAGLVPALPPSQSLLERAQEMLAGIGSRLQGLGPAGDSVAVQFAAASCLAIGALPGVAPEQADSEPVVESQAARPAAQGAHRATAGSDPHARSPRPSPPVQSKVPEENATTAPPIEAPPPEAAPEETTEAPTYEYVPPVPVTESPEADVGSAAGEFGP
jgi:RNA polymerase sigma factor (sigma-70 family)